MKTNESVLNRFPVEIWERIFDLLDSKSLQSVQKVCPHWKSLVLGYVMNGRLGNRALVWTLLTSSLMPDCHSLVFRVVVCRLRGPVCPVLLISFFSPHWYNAVGKKLGNLPDQKLFIVSNLSYGTKNTLSSAALGHNSPK